MARAVLFPSVPLCVAAFWGRFYFAGDQVTWRTGWQEGAVIAAWGAVQSINRQTRHG
jgi:monoamine oxidase